MESCGIPVSFYFILCHCVHVIVSMGSQWCLLVLQVLNEVVIDRGPSSYLCNLDLYIEGHLVTSVLGDGEEQTFFNLPTLTLSLSLLSRAY